MGNLSRLSKAKTRSISAENPTGEKGKGGMATSGTGKKPARELGQGWKVSPSVNIKSGEVFDLADIGGPGEIQSIWISGDVSRKGPLARYFILRIYWDDQEIPSVECPIADFFSSALHVSGVHLLVSLTSLNLSAHLCNSSVVIEPGAGQDS